MPDGRCLRQALVFSRNPARTNGRRMVAGKARMNVRRTRGPGLSPLIGAYSYAGSATAKASELNECAYSSEDKSRAY